MDIVRNAWTYDRWFTSEWPDDSKWSLVSDGKPVRVVSYGANSGSTPADGVTADLVSTIGELMQADLDAVKPLPISNSARR